MPEVYENYKTRHQPIDAAASLAPLPAKTLARRRRIMRFGGVMTFLLGVGFSSIPGPKGSSHTIKSSNVNGVQTQVHQYFFSRHFGLPFLSGRIDYNDDGSIKAFKIEGDGFLRNLGVALGIVVIGSIFVGRRRRDD